MKAEINNDQLIVMIRGIIEEKAKKYRLPLVPYFARATAKSIVKLLNIRIVPNSFCDEIEIENIKEEIYRLKEFTGLDQS